MKRKEFFSAKNRIELLETSKLQLQQHNRPEEYEDKLHYIQRLIENIEKGIGEFSSKEVLGIEDRDTMHNLSRTHKRLILERNDLLVKMLAEEANHKKNFRKYMRRDRNEDDN